MIRKLFMAAALAAVPMSAVGVGLVASGTPAAAASPINCALTGSIAFAPPGLSYTGTLTTNPTSVTETSDSNTGCSGGTLTSASPLAITTKNTKCAKTQQPATPPGCVKPNKYYDSVAGFASAPLSTIEKAIKHLGLTINGTAAKTKATSASEVQGTGGACGASDGAGFILGGSVKDKAEAAYTAFSIHICLSTDTGTELASSTPPRQSSTSSGSSFFTDVSDAVFGGPDVVATATIDPSESFINIS